MPLRNSQPQRAQPLQIHCDGSNDNSRCTFFVIRLASQEAYPMISLKIRSSVIIILSLLFVRSVQASTYNVTASQQPSTTHTFLSLSGEMSYCDPFLGGFVGAPIVTISSNDIQVLSTIFAGECQAPPIGFVPPPPTPYRVSRDVGILPDGNYNVTWILDNISFPGNPRNYTALISVVNGPAPAARGINTLSSEGLTILLLTLCLASWWKNER